MSPFNGREPLQRKTILVTRARKQASELVKHLESLGGFVMEFPVIETVPPKNALPMDQAIQNLGQYQWIIFTSSNGVAFFMDRLAKLQSNGLDNWSGKVAVVGPRTAEVLRDYGRMPDLIADDFKAEGLLQSLKSILVGSESILFPRSSIARPFLAKELEALRFKVTEVDAYDTVKSSDKAEEVIQALNEGKIDFITFTSSSTVKNFCEAVLSEQQPIHLENVKIVCIGPVTAETAQTHQLSVAAVAQEHTIEGLVDALLRLV